MNFSSFTSIIIILITLMMIEQQQNFQLNQSINESIKCGMKYLDQTIGITIQNDQIYQIIKEKTNDGKVDLKIIIYKRVRKKFTLKNYRLNLIDGRKYDLEQIFLKEPSLKKLIENDIFNWQQQQQQPSGSFVKPKLFSATLIQQVTENQLQNNQSAYRFYCFKSFDGKYYKFSDYNLQTTKKLNNFDYHFDQTTHLTIVTDNLENIYQIQYTIDQDDGDNNGLKSKVIVYKLKSDLITNYNNLTDYYKNYEFITNLYVFEYNETTTSTTKKMNNNNNKQYRLISIKQSIPMNCEQSKLINQLTKRLFNEMFTYGFIDNDFYNYKHERIFLISNQNKRIVTFDKRVLTIDYKKDNNLLYNNELSSFSLKLITFQKFFHCKKEKITNNHENNDDDNNENSEDRNNGILSLLQKKLFRNIIYISIIIILLLILIQLILLNFGFECFICSLLYCKKDSTSTTTKTKSKLQNYYLRITSKTSLPITSESISVKETTTKKRSKSPKNESKSPKNESKSPKKRSKSPKERSKSPKKRSKSPKERSKSPKKRSKSPKNGSESPTES